MKIYEEDDEYSDFRKMIEADKIHREEEKCKLILGIIFLIVMAWIFADPIIRAMEHDDYKSGQVQVTEVTKL